MHVHKIEMECGACGSIKAQPAVLPVASDGPQAATAAVVTWRVSPARFPVFNILPWRVVLKNNQVNKQTNINHRFSFSIKSARLRAVAPLIWMRGGARVAVIG